MICQVFILTIQKLLSRHRKPNVLSQLRKRKVEQAELVFQFKPLYSLPLQFFFLMFSVYLYLYVSGVVTSTPLSTQSCTPSVIRISKLLSSECWVHQGRSTALLPGNSEIRQMDPKQSYLYQAYQIEIQNFIKFKLFRILFCKVKPYTKYI